MCPRFFSFFLNDFSEGGGKCYSGIWDLFLKGTFDFSSQEFGNTLSPFSFLFLHSKNSC